MRLAREWDLRFEKLFRTGALSKWYSSVGHEGITVPAASALEPGDALLTLHRDSGAILRYYLDADRLFPNLLGGSSPRPAPQGDPNELLYRLACQMLGKHEGFSNGYERSYHYGFVDESIGNIHIGMISHLGSMIPVAAGAALAFKQRGSDRVALNFIGDGATSTGEFHEGLNMAAVLRLPFILIIENNQYAFSTPLDEQFACRQLIDRAEGYGIPGVRVEAQKPDNVLAEMQKAVARARAGEGPTLIEAVTGRLRGHSEGDDSLGQVPAADLARFKKEDAVEVFEARLVEDGICDRAYLDRVAEACKKLLIDTVDRAQSSADADPDLERAVYAR